MKTKILILIVFCLISLNAIAQTPTNMSICGVSFANNLTTFKEKMLQKGITIAGSGKRNSGKLEFAGIENCSLHINPYSFDDVFVHHIEISLPVSWLNAHERWQLLHIYTAKYGSYKLTLGKESELYEWKVKNNLGEVTLEFKDKSVVINYYDYKNRHKHFNQKEYFKDI